MDQNYANGNAFSSDWKIKKKIKLKVGLWILKITHWQVLWQLELSKNIICMYANNILYTVLSAPPCPPAWQSPWHLYSGSGSSCRWFPTRASTSMPTRPSSSTMRQDAEQLMYFWLKKMFIDFRDKWYFRFKSQHTRLLSRVQPHIRLFSPTDLMPVSRSRCQNQIPQRSRDKMMIYQPRDLPGVISSFGFLGKR